MTDQDLKQINAQVAWEQDSHARTRRLLDDTKAQLDAALTELAALKLQAKELEIQQTRLGGGL